MTSSRLAALAVAASMTGVLGMAACGQGSAPGTQSPGEQASAGTVPSSAATSASATSTPATSTAGAGTTPGAAETTALLQLNDSLKTRLGAAYADAWIEGDKLHVAVTTKDAETIAANAGAIPTLVTINAAELEKAVEAVAAWQTRLPSAQGAAIHRIIPDGRTGTVTIYVAPAELAAVARAAAADKPTGSVPLLLKESTGIPTPSQPLG
ncbi:hypothetical protein [Arthrobacter sp. A2-55]|uniref:hypothetical protein n=1 Tax=Arthrobacter sp. A2-55 TaxID=2897337 RepID=UPI0021CDE4EB|nr:hypothetical protein [Arthrobacter sp. A2-55]MCU6478982.1 hypothetical protein [Arthrobacter sp. A2-55]